MTDNLPLQIRSVSEIPHGTSHDDHGEQSDSSTASAPSRIEGNEIDTDEEDEDSDDSDGDAMNPSVLEDALDRAEEEPYYNESLDNTIPKEEAARLRQHLRKVGPARFISETLTSGKYDIRTLVTAFGVRPDYPFDDQWYLRMLGLSIQREVDRRQKLDAFNTLEDVVALIQKCQKIMVITGAGISTSLGIPDFRSKNTGFYSQLLARGISEPEEVFDIHTFDEDPTTFYSLAKDILPVTDRCSPTHAFIKLLQDKNKLLTNYTQNIDNIEQYAGISADRLIQCHGSWARAVCRKCAHNVPGIDIFPDVRAGRVPKCTRCPTLLSADQPRKRKRGSSSKSRKASFSDSSSDGDYDIPEAGVMKPAITFFHEQLPNTFFDRLTDHDRDVVDLVIVIGTSMKVSPVNQIPNYIPAEVPHVYISRDPAPHIKFDVSLIGYCDDIVGELARRAGWRIEHGEFDASTQAVVESFDESGHHWRVAVPGTQHTAEEVANPGV